MKSGTIAAIATSLTESGISIIRISGEDAFKIADHIFISKSQKKVCDFKSQTIHYGMIVENEEPVDEVLLSVFRSPHSYTTEDVVEINCHGGILLTKKILSFILKNGAELAQPGEFTKRAFLNGRIDLVKAQAVMDLIEADSDIALRNGMNQLSGRLSSSIKKIRESILYEIAFIESALDDPEHIILDHYEEKLQIKVIEIKKELSKMYDSYDDGSKIKDGINTVILGKPNAGKSSLLNFLSGKERAIVTDIAGTTRDLLEETVLLQDVKLNLIDTAGIHEAEDEVERIGINRAKNAAKEADLLLYIVDASKEIDQNDLEIIKMTHYKNQIVLLNKTDLEQITDIQDVKNIFSNFENMECENIKFINISAKTGDGIEELVSTIKSMFLKGIISLNNEVMITNLRQRGEIKEALDSLSYVLKSIEESVPEDFLTIDLVNAYESLGRMIGEEIGEDVVNEIFSKFCMGK